MVRVSRGPGADAPGVQIRFADRAHLRLTNLDCLRRRQSVGIDRRIAARVGESRQVVAQNTGAIIHTHRRRIGNNPRNILNHKRINGRSVIAWLVGNITELPAQGPGSAGRRLCHQRVTEIGTAYDGEAFQRHTYRQIILHHDVSRGVFLQIQRQIVGYGIANANDRIGRAGRCLGIRVPHSRFGNGSVIERSDADSRRTVAVIIECIGRRATDAGALG